MIKRLFKRRPKRTTFWKMFAKGMIIPIIITVILGKYSSFFIKQSAFSYGYSQMKSFISAYEGRLVRNTNQKVPYPLFFSMFGDVDAQPVGGYIDPKTWVEPNNRTVTFTFDKDGNIINSSRAKIGIAIRTDKGPGASLWYYYDPQEFKIAELDKLIDDALKDRNSGKCTLELDITSLYLNEEEQKMIPHTIKVTRYKTNNRFGYEYDEEWTKLSEYTINVDYESADGYILTNLSSRYDREEKYPCGSLQGIYGTPPQFFDEIVEEYIDNVREFTDSDYSGSSNSGGDYNTQVIDVLMNRLYAEGEEEGIFAYIETNVHGLHAWRRLVFVIGALFGLMTLFVFVISFSRNVKNKAQYAFEDYQRALTNNLAHDLKTPLAVIGGYAENLLEMRKDSGDAKELQYLSSIMNNVSYTDDIIAKTLKLSETEQKKKPNKKKVDIKALAEKCAEKYKDAFEEHGIEISIEGSGEVNADEDSLSLAVDNLISNAVKYTRNDGSVKITVSKKEFVIENDTVEDIDTKELKMPFVKGDKARSDKSSSGLGLSIAEAAAVQNGFALKLSCKDKKFKAMIEM